MESERKEQLLEPLTDTEGYTVPFGVHVRAIDLQLPPLPAVSSQRHRAIAAGSSDVVPRWIPIKLDPLDSDYGSAWDFAAKLQEKSGVDKLDGQYSAEIVSHSKPGDEDEPIFATPLELLDEVTKPQRRYVPLTPPSSSRSHSRIVARSGGSRIDTAIPLLDQQ